MQVLVLARREVKRAHLKNLLDGLDIPVEEFLENL
jgi:hypothetical protein